MATWEKRAGRTCKAIFDLWNQSHIHGVVRGYMAATNQNVADSISDILHNAPLLQQMAERCEITVIEVCDVVEKLKEDDSALCRFGG